MAKDNWPKINISENISNQVDDLAMGRLLKNLASNHSVFTTESGADHIQELLGQVFDKVVENEPVIFELKLIRRELTFPLEIVKRPEVFRRLNLLLGGFFAKFETEREVFELCFEIMTLMTRQVEEIPQKDKFLAEKEWVEFEKSVYLLTDWEDQFKETQPAVLHPEK